MIVAVTSFAAPFEVCQGPLRQFCELAYDGHAHYRTLELQYLDIAPERRGYVVLMGRHDGKLNVMSEPALSLDKAWCRSDPAITHYRLGLVETVDLEGVVLRTGIDGVEARVAFDDPDGRRIEMTVASASKGPAKARRLFIPATPKPEVRMLWFLYAFAFGPLRPSDHIDMKIDGETLTPRRWPWPLGLRRHVQGRYANDISIFSLNPPKDEPRAFIGGDDAFVLEDGAATPPRIRSWRQSVNGHDVSVCFDPPISSVPLDGQATPGVGTLTVSVDDIAITKGRYRLSIQDGRTDVLFADIDQYWNPPNKDLSVWLLELYRRVKLGRRRWCCEATLEAGNDGLHADNNWIVR